MVFDMSGRDHPAGQLREIVSPAHQVELFAFFQRLFHRQDVDGLLFAGQLLDGLIDLLMLVLIKALRRQQVKDPQDRIFLQHDGPQHGLLQLHRLRG